MAATSNALKDRNVIQLTADLLAQFPEVEDALQLAAYAHDGQIRKEVRDGAEHRDPYIIHPIRLALRIARWGVLADAPEVQLIVLRSALLHDVPEDAEERMFRYLELDRSHMSANSALSLSFGTDLANTVGKLTNPEILNTLEGLEKQARYLAHILKTVISDLYAILVKASDLVDNAGSLKHMAPGSKRTALAHKYLEPVKAVSDSLVYFSQVEHLPEGVPLTYNLVRGLSRAQHRLEQVFLELADIIENS